MDRQSHLPTQRAFVIMAALAGTALGGTALVNTALVDTLLGGTVLAAQGPGPGGQRGRGPGLWRGLGRGIASGGRGAGLALRALDLTDAQREQVRQLTEQHREQTRTLVERARAAGEAQRQAMDAPSFSEQQVRAAAQAFAEARTDLAVQQARLRSDVYALLTPEQQQRLQQLQAEREVREKERRDRMQQRRQGQPSP